jgi:hypothetical protein
MKRLIVWILLGLVLALYLVLASPASAVCDPCTDFDQVIDPPQYLIHATGHGTTSGPVKDDWWFLFPQAPDSKGGLLLPDGSGGTFGYSTDHSSGPYTTPRAACAAAAAAGVQDFVVTPWGWESHWYCKDVNGVNGNDNGGNNNGGSPTDTPIPEPTDTPESPGPTTQLNARLDCGDSLSLPAGNPAQPETCGIFVSGYRINTSDDVIYTFPTLIPSQGVGEMLPGPIDVSPGNWSENPSNFLDSGPEHHTLPWHFARCPQPGVCTTATPPGTYAVPIIVSQNGAGAVTLNLTLIVPPSTTTTGNVVFTFLDRPGDFVGKYDFRPDGVQDARFHLIVPDGGTQITYLRLEQVDENNFQINSGPVWDTQPNPNNPGAWLLGVFRADNGQQLNSADYTLNPMQIAVPADLQLLATDSDSAPSYFQAGQRFMVTIQFDDQVSSAIQVSTTVP